MKEIILYILLAIVLQSSPCFYCYPPKKRSWNCYLGAPANAIFICTFTHLTKQEAVNKFREKLLNEQRITSPDAERTIDHHNVLIIAPTNHDPQQHPTNYNYCHMLNPKHNRDAFSKGKCHENRTQK